jgi:protein required for attachment to host cells
MKLAHDAKPNSSKEHSGREQDEMQFADQVAEYLDRGVRMGDFHKIVLFAEHKFLGLLRERLSNAAKQAVVFEAPKNLTKLDESDIKRYFT